jgi:hypothetical protein
MEAKKPLKTEKRRPCPRCGDKNWNCDCLARAIDRIMFKNS